MSRTRKVTFGITNKIETQLVSKNTSIVDIFRTILHKAKSLEYTKIADVVQALNNKMQNDNKPFKFDFTGRIVAY
jgi:hypothetical protein